MSDEWVALGPEVAAKDSTSELVSPAKRVKYFGNGDAEAPESSKMNVLFVDMLGDITEKEAWDGNHIVQTEVNALYLNHLRSRLNVITRENGNVFLVIEELKNNSILVHAAAIAVPQTYVSVRDRIPAPKESYVSCMDDQVYRFIRLVSGAASDDTGRVLITDRNKNSQRPEPVRAAAAAGGLLRAGLNEGLFGLDDLDGDPGAEPGAGAPGEHTLEKIVRKAMRTDFASTNFASGAFTELHSVGDEAYKENAMVWAFDAPVPVSQAPALSRYAIKADDPRDPSILTGAFVFAVEAGLEMAGNTCPWLKKEGKLLTTRETRMPPPSMTMHWMRHLEEAMAHRGVTPYYVTFPTKLIWEAVKRSRGLNVRAVHERFENLNASPFATEVGVQEFIDIVIEGKAPPRQQSAPAPEPEPEREMTVKGLLDETFGDERFMWLRDIIGYFMIRHVLDGTGEEESEGTLAAREREPIRFWFYDYTKDDVGAVAIAILGFGGVSEPSNNDLIRVASLSKVISLAIARGVMKYKRAFEALRSERVPSIIHDPALAVPFSELVSRLLTKYEITSARSRYQFRVGEAEAAEREVALKMRALQIAAGGAPPPQWLVE